MSPDRRARRGKGSRITSVPPAVRTRPGPSDTYAVVYYKRHIEDDPSETEPGRQFLAACPPKVKAHMMAVAVAVAAAPPHKFSGGGYWEAMHGQMAGFYEIRVDGPGRTHYRLFCLLDSDAQGVGPLLVILCGESKRFRSTLSEAAYRRVRALGDEYAARNPRSIVS